MTGDVRCETCGTLIRWWWSMCDTCWRRRQEKSTTSQGTDR